MVLLILCIMMIFAVLLLQILLFKESEVIKDNWFNVIINVVGMNVLLYFAVTYIIEKASLIGWL